MVSGAGANNPFNNVARQILQSEISSVSRSQDGNFLLINANKMIKIPKASVEDILKGLKFVAREQFSPELATTVSRIESTALESFPDMKKNRIEKSVNQYVQALTHSHPDAALKIRSGILDFAPEGPTRSEIQDIFSKIDQYVGMFKQVLSASPFDLAKLNKKKDILINNLQNNNVKNQTIKSSVTKILNNMIEEADAEPIKKQTRNMNACSILGAGWPAISRGGYNGNTVNFLVGQLLRDTHGDSDIGELNETGKSDNPKAKIVYSQHQTVAAPQNTSSLETYIKNTIKNNSFPPIKKVFIPMNFGTPGSPTAHASFLVLEPGNAGGMTCTLINSLGTGGGYKQYEKDAMTTAAKALHSQGLVPKVFQNKNVLQSDGTTCGIHMTDNIVKLSCENRCSDSIHKLQARSLKEMAEVSSGHQEIALQWSHSLLESQFSGDSNKYQQWYAENEGLL
ncbi:MAG: hypothetical protein ACI9YB_002613 [Halioglobus sp.]|jgi:hypothetical protein